MTGEAVAGVTLLCWVSRYEPKIPVEKVQGALVVIEFVIVLFRYIMCRPAFTQITADMNMCVH